MTFQDWQKRSQELRERLNRFEVTRRDLLQRECDAAGLPMMGNCIHNATLDTELKGWCFQNPALLHTAKRINRMWNDYRASEIVDRVLSRMFDQVQR